ncbi:lytic transglycosylase domain-containing protein [Usitatibacter palustris]|nr:lytic transglycosylase domain-containing protein [Usitatibacter palustris]
MTRRVLIAVALVASAAAFAQAPVTESDLLSARDAYTRNNVKALESARARFAGHLLEPYPSYWVLAIQLEKAEPAEVHAFLARWPESPLSETLRRDWLKVLGNAKAWETFRGAYAKYQGDDPDVACYAFQERMSRNDPELPGEVRALFVSGKEVPTSCDPVFATIAGTKAIGERETWERLRKLLVAGALKDVRRTNGLLPAKISINEKALERAHAQPARFLMAEKIPAVSRAGTELTLFAFARLARSKPDEAAERLAALAPKLGADDARFAWGQVAWWGAMSHNPRALDWYELAGETPLTDAQLMWKARAGLRAADWNAVFAAIRAMSPEEAREPNWRYWRARAVRAKGSAEGADALLRTLAAENNFYGLLAAEDLGISRVPDWNGWRPQPADLDRVRAMPGIQRALALYRIDMPNEAFREWFWGVRGLDDRDLLSAAELARQANLPDRAINTAERTLAVHDFAQRYPVPHREAMTAAAKQFDLDEAWVYGIIRQESRFMAEAKSRVGATGLMQLMPATARWVAKQIPVSGYQSTMLTRPEVNVQMGSFYYRKVLDDLGDPVLAAAAYNAGPGRARRWRDAQPLEGAIYAETIPFNETRDYVKKVVANAWFYTHRLTGKPASMKGLLGNVPRASGEAVAASLP